MQNIYGGEEHHGQEIKTWVPGLSLPPLVNTIIKWEHLMD